MNRSRFISVFFMVISITCMTAFPVHAEGPALQKIVIMPFNTHTPNELQYLHKGIPDLFASRLSTKEEIQVINAASTKNATASLKGDISPDDASRIAKSLGADYVLFGTVTAVGQILDIDATMAPVLGNTQPSRLTLQTKNFNDVIPKINQFAQEIQQKVLGQPAQGSETGGSEEKIVRNRNPELLPAGSADNKDRISSLNPNFIEITSESSLRQPGLWRSQTFTSSIVSMDLGDIDGDGKVEMVTVTPNRVTAYRRDANGMRSIGIYDGVTSDNFVWVTLVDTNHDRTQEIYLTNLRKKNSTLGTGDRSVLGDRGYTEEVEGIRLSLSGGSLKPVGKRVPYFLNGVDFPGRGKVLLGQQKGLATEGPFRGEIVELQLRGNVVEPVSPVSLPAPCNIFNFAVVDLNDDRSNEYVAILPNHTMVVLNNSGEQLWKSQDLFGATTNSFEGKVIDRRFNHVENYSIPCPILVSDLNKDGVPEIIVNRNTDTSGLLMPQGAQYWERGEIVSLSWNQMGLVENWKTKEISGMITCLRNDDLNNDHTAELVASLVLPKDSLKLWESKSTILSYDLNIGNEHGNDKIAIKGK